MTATSARLVVIGMLLSAAPIAAQSHPNFSGVWTLDSTKTKVIGRIGPSTTETDTIVQHGDSVTWHSVGTDGNSGGYDERLVWRIDGQPWSSTNPNPPSRDLVSTVRSQWLGDTLSSTVSVTLVDQSELVRVEKWTLGNQGRTLTMVTTISGNGVLFGTVTELLNKR